MRFAYTALKANGVEIRDFVDADSQNDAVNRIRRRGQFPTQVMMPDDVKKSPGEVYRKPFSERLEDAWAVLTGRAYLKRG